MADVVNAFVRSPNYRRGALFIVYDEWGGFFDHVRPPRVPDKRATANLDTDFGQMGFRIPALAISPYTRGAAKNRPDFRVDHGIHGHESILKLISHRFGLGHLTKRHRYARNIGHSFDWANPDFDPPTLPDPPEVASTRLPTGRRQHLRPERGPPRRPGRPERAGGPVRLPHLRRPRRPDLHRAGLGQAQLQEGQGQDG